MRALRTSISLTLLALAFMALGAQPASAGACASASATASSATAAQLSNATLCLLNEERSKRGLRVLRPNRRLTLAARRHASDMVRRDYFSHETPAGTTFVTRIRRAGYTAPAVGENLACGSGSYATPAATVQGWMKSPGHRRNILNRRFRDAGLGIVPGAPTLGGSDSATYALTFGGR